MVASTAPTSVNRSAFILGSALLVVAATLAATITVRNAPPDRRAADAGRTRGPQARALAPAAGAPDSHLQAARPGPSRRPSPGQFTVSVSPDWLAGLPAGEQEEFRQRVARVQQKACGRLDRMTDEFDLTADQRGKMFPLLVRSTPGFDPAMQVAGGYLDGAPATADEELHGLLDAEQQAQLEDQELNRQLWWQEVFSRLEKELVDSTGGGAAEPAEPAAEPAAAEPAAEPAERVAPTRR